jgi:hypothetical protein
MLNQTIIEKISKFVNEEPRSINEIANHLNKNWRTIDRYIEKIIQDFGNLKTKTFRGGTRGALKIVYSAPIEQISSTTIQKQLEEDILSTKNKNDFSAFDIYQNVDINKKQITIEKEIQENQTNLRELDELIQNTQKQLLLFSGNLSWINLKNKEINFYNSLESLIKRNVKIKVICEVDLSGKENIEKLLALNYKYGKELIEVHHKKQPLRAIIFDGKISRLKEIKEPTGKIKELNKKVFLFYTIKDKNWTEWIIKIFYKMFNESINSQKRLDELNKIV